MAVSDSFQEFVEFERSVAEALRKERKKRNISLKEMAERIGMHHNTLSKFENNGFRLALDVLYGYAQVCELPISAFITPHDVPRSPGANPLIGLSDAEMIRYSELLQKLFQVFHDDAMKLSGESLYEATRLAAKAVQEQRNGF